MSCLDDVVKIHRPSGRESVPINARRWKPIQASRPRLRHWGWRRSTGRNWWRSLLQFDRGRRGVLPFRSDPTATLAPPPPADRTAAVRSDTLKTNIQNRCKRERKINTRKFHTPHTHTHSQQSANGNFLMRNNVCNSLDGEKEHQTFLLFSFTSAKCV